MASLEEEMGMVFADPVPHVLAKGKRTKRNRSLLFSNNTSGDSDFGLWQPDDDTFTFLEDSFDSSPATSAGGMASEEEEDMANCLILLAQGLPRGLQRSHEPVTTTAATSAYQCKTCSKVFSSFQALGGHRASHKKPKLFEIERRQLSTVVVQPSHRTRPHECSFCGAEFATGQALGGHMRRHRGAVQVPGGGGGGGVRGHGGNLLALDLNLPAPPEEDHWFREVKVEGKKKRTECGLVFSTTAALVDCHY